MKLAIVTVLCVVSALGGSFAHAAAKPNVLFIAVDDLNHWVDHLGCADEQERLKRDASAIISAQRP